MVADPNLPVPDPTARATEIVDKGLAALREMLEVKIQAEHDLCNEKFDGIAQRLDDNAARTREQKDDTKNALMDALTAADNAIRLQTTASEKAIDKSEQATAKELSQMAATFGTAIAGLSDKFDGLRASTAALMPRTEWDVAHKAVEAGIFAVDRRVTSIESVKVGNTETRTAIIALISVISTLLVIGGIVAAAWPR